MSRILRRIDVRRILVVLGLLFVGLIAGTNSYGLLETEIDSVLPDTLLPGDESIELVIEGEEFISDCFIEFEPPLVIVDEIEFISDGELRVVVSVPLSAPPTPLTVIYVDEAGPSLEFPDLLEIIGLPIITGFDPLELEGPAPEQEITLFGDYFNEDWAETLSATATLNNLDGPQLVASLLTWMNEYTLLVTVDTPEELYLPPCSLELEVVDPLSAGSFSCSLPIDVEEPPLVEPSISAIEASVSSSVELGTYPLELQVEISLTGENLPVGGDASDLAAAIQSHEIKHLMLQDKGTLALDVDSETSASGYVELELLNDDRSFAEDAEGSLELLLLSESFAADYDLELNWSGPVLDPSLVLECADTLTGSQIGDAMLLDENPINVEAVLTGDYFPTDLELDSLEVEVSGGPLEVAGYDLQRQSAGQAVIDIELMPLGAEVELSASIGLTVEVGIGTDVLTGALDLPVELEMLVRAASGGCSKH